MTQAYRQPQYLEQLVPANLLEEYGIQSKTELPAFTATFQEAVAQECVWHVQETEEALRTVLTNNGVKPMICQEKGKKDGKELKENRKRLMALAKTRGVKILFYGGPSAVPATAAPTKKAVAK